MGTPTETVQDCRDPDDNIYLELALAAQATTIITGDADLLTLHPWRDIHNPVTSRFPRNHLPELIHTTSTRIQPLRVCNAVSASVGCVDIGTDGREARV